jgi:hypothetical protein
VASAAAGSDLCALVSGVAGFWAANASGKASTNAAANLVTCCAWKAFIMRLLENGMDLIDARLLAAEKA